MNTRYLLIVTLPLALSFALVTVDPGVASTGEDGEAFPLADVMRRISDRMASLWYAGQHENVELMEYELREIREAVQRIEDAGVSEKGMPIAPILQAAVISQDERMIQQVNDGDLEGFRKSYESVLHTCNACHKSSGYEFIRVTVPKNPPYPNQAWEPVQE